MAGRRQRKHNTVAVMLHMCVCVKVKTAASYELCKHIDVTSAGMRGRRLVATNTDRGDISVWPPCYCCSSPPHIHNSLVPQLVNAWQQ